ncbi:MAG: amino acid permease [Parachlamydiales bacterium]|nr:amino acid permease [Parachlamydiales bacterium]
MKKSYHITTFSLVMITSAFVIGIRNLPTLAETGIHIIFFTFIASIGCLLPIGFISAELATGWPKEGGVYLWVKEAFGERWGFLSIYLQWIQNVVWFPAALAFFASTFSYSFFPSWANNPLYLLVVILCVFWGTTFLNLRGMKTSSWISSSCVILGVFLPAAVIIVLAAIYFFLGKPLQIKMYNHFWEYLPSLGRVSNMTVLLGVVFSLIGAEASAVHIKDVSNPQRKYPIAIFSMIIIAIIFSILGALSISIVISQKDISLISGVMEAFEIFLRLFHLQWLVPVMSLLISFGILGQISTWIVGPSKGMLVSAKDGNIPPYFQMVRNGMPSRILYFQAFIVTFLSLFFFFMPTINAAYWMLITMTAILYMSMYLLMYAAVVKLRYTQPHVKRGFQVPGGKIGLWAITLWGSFFCCATIFVGLFPPKQIIATGVWTYEMTLLGGLVVLLAIPFILFQLSKKSWKKKAS